VPVALVVLLGQVVATGSLAAAYASDPIGWTSRFVLLPLLIVAVPLSVLYEQKRRRAIRIARRFPDTLNRLASANQMGIPFTEALGLVSGWSSNEITAELRKTHNEIQWCNNPRAALLGLGNRLGVPQVKRTMTLTATGLHSTSDLSKILSIAAKDTRIRHDLDRSRRKNMNAYVVIVAIGFLVYLAVVVLLDHHYLVPVSRISAEVNGDAVNALPIANVTEIPVSQYRTLLFHSAIVQGAGSGLLAGKLTENELLAGLKYSIVLVVISIVAFTVV
jgi:flagellar protein FlaJ